jgi:mannose-6-phosphate isomerase-like protein (cupin superfamily)
MKAILFSILTILFGCSLHAADQQQPSQTNAPSKPEKSEIVNRFKIYRRVVTGTDSAGKSIVMSDGPVPPEGSWAKVDQCGADLWFTPSLPVDLSDDHDPIAAGYKGGWPPAQGVTFRMITWQPGFSVPMHQSNTVDFCIVLSGRLKLILEAGSAMLEPGDSVVQRGTRHGWRVVGDQPVTAVAILLGARPKTVTISPNQSLEPTTRVVTPAAGQPSRQP